MLSNTKKPLISVCCTTYNHEQFVDEAINSICSQNIEDIEIIVVDDGSVDKTYEKLKSLSKKSKFLIHIIRQENTGNIPQNINKAIRKARGEFLMFMSLDDVLLPNKIDILLKEINLDKNTQLVIPSMTTIIDANGKLSN